jgi:hypothetical protein
MIKYGAGMDAYLKSLSNLAPVKDAIKASEDLTESFAHAQESIQKLGSSVALELDPQMKSLLDGFSKWIDDNQKLETSNIVTWVHNLADGLKTVGDDAQAVVDVLNLIVKGENWVAAHGPGAAAGAFANKFGPQQPGTGEATPIPWGQWWKNTGQFFKRLHMPDFDISAHAGELPPEIDEGAFESRRARSRSSFGDSGLTIQGQQISRGNPMPVDIVRIAGSGADANSLLGGPIGSGGGAAPAGNSGGGTAGGASRVLRDRAGAGKGSPSLTTGQQNAAAMHMIDRLMSHGWTEEAAAIAAGNAMQESGFNPNGPAGDPSIPGGSHGVMQWNRDRLTALKAYAASQGKPWTDYDTQIDFLVKEARSRVPTWPSQHGLGSAGAISHAYEGYGDNSTGRRIGNANKFYHMHHNVSPAIKTPGGSDPIVPPGHLPAHPHTLTPTIHGNGTTVFQPLTEEDKKHIAKYNRQEKIEQDIKRDFENRNWTPEKPWLHPGQQNAMLMSGGARLSSLAATHPVTTSSTSNAIHIGKIDVDARGGDSQDIANNLHAALERSTSTLLAQSGQVVSIRRGPQCRLSAERSGIGPTRGGGYRRIRAF